MESGLGGRGREGEKITPSDIPKMDSVAKRIKLKLKKKTKMGRGKRGAHKQWSKSDFDAIEILPSQGSSARKIARGNAHRGWTLSTVKRHISDLGKGASSLKSDMFSSFLILSLAIILFGGREWWSNAWEE